MSESERDPTNEHGILLHRALYVLEQACTCAGAACPTCKLRADIEVFFERSDARDEAAIRRGGADLADRNLSMREVADGFARIARFGADAPTDPRLPHESDDEAESALRIAAWRQAHEALGACKDGT
jgi:hypothetical protein